MAGLAFNAMVWGLSWWPMRQLHEAGLHPLWSTAIMFGVISAVIGSIRPAAWRDVLTQPGLWLIVLASGVTNASFNWGVTVGDVVRVVLLFYVMPLWAVLLAWLILGEKPGPGAILRVLLAVGGAVAVLWPAEGQPLGQFQLVDGLGLLGGFSFAFNNVMLRRQVRSAPTSRGLAMFLGGVLVASAMALLTDAPAPPVAEAAAWLPGALLLGLAFLASNMSFQYGASRLPAHVTAVVMLTEVLWAAGSALLLGAGSLTLPLLIGGGLILASAALAALRP